MVGSRSPFRLRPPFVYQAPFVYRAPPLRIVRTLRVLPVTVAPPAGFPYTQVIVI